MRKYTPEERMLIKKHSDTLKTLRKLYKNCKTLFALEVFQSAIRDACAKGYPIDFTLQNSQDTLLNTILDRPNYLVNGYYAYKAIETLLELGANPNHLNNYGNTPLGQCASNQMGNCFDLLLKYGADPNICNVHGENALMIAAVWGYDYNISIKILEKIKDINQQNEKGRTVLGYVCGQYISSHGENIKKSNMLLIRALLFAGADPDIDTSWEEESNWDKYDLEEKVVRREELRNYFQSYRQKNEELRDSFASVYDYEL